jgi:hypothetical protein
MLEPSQFEQYARGALAIYGVELDDADIAVMQTLNGLYGPLQDQLIATSFADIPPEHDLDPSRAPT